MDNNENRNAARLGPIMGSRVTRPLPELRQEWLPQPTTANAAVIKPTKKSGLPAGLLGLMLVVGLLLGAGGTAAVLALTRTQTPAVANASTTTPTAAAAAVVPTAAPQDSQPVAALEPNTIRAIYAKLSPSVLRINSTISGDGQFGGGGSGSGTGIVVDKAGHILTNNHVIEGATTIKVELSDGSEYNATVVGNSPQDDLAIIKADIPTDKLIPADLGDSSNLQPGDAVIAIGYPFGLDQSVTSGIISGVNRDWASEGSRTMRGLIQTDAAINPGNSGGPLLNDQGQVIGINTLIESPVRAFTGIGLAIPINRAKDLIPTLEQGGELQRPWIGISGSEVTPSLKQELGLTIDRGIVVVTVIAGGPGEQAGLLPAEVTEQTQSLGTATIHDIIVTIDGNAVGSIAELTGYLDGKKPGDKVTLGIIRDGKNQDVEVTLQPWPATSIDQALPTPQVP